MRVKQGQIAHINRDSADNQSDNLCFLCFDHHDQYDSITRQSKGITSAELKAYQIELYDSLKQSFETVVHFGVMQPPAGDPYAGKYVDVGRSPDFAEVQVIPIPDGLSGAPRYTIVGFATWGSWREHGPNIGELTAVGELDKNKLYYTEPSIGSDENWYHLAVEFTPNGLELKEQNGFSRYGMNVSFNGSYRRTT